MPAPAAETAVVEALRQGDEEVFVGLVDRHQASLRRVARLFLSNSAAVDDVVQETWLAVIQGLWAFEGRSSLKTWILRILINRAKTRAARDGRMMAFAGSSLHSREASDDSPDEVAPDLRLSDPGPSAEERLLTREARTQIRAAIDSLPARERAVITLKDLEGCSSREVCNVLGLTETNQRVILHRARSRVRAMLSAYIRKE